MRTIRKKVKEYELTDYGRCFVFKAKVANFLNKLKLFGSGGKNRSQTQKEE
ncbi:MAG: hypothetical protein AAB706_04315 [Patescibacteria group bacterium]